MNINVQFMAAEEGADDTLAHACVKARMGDFMLGNSTMKLLDINYARTC